jgi:hypothetical protein
VQAESDVQGIVNNASEIPEDQLLCNVCMNHKVQVMFKCREQLTSPRKFFLP